MWTGAPALQNLAFYLLFILLALGKSLNCARSLPCLGTHGDARAVLPARCGSCGDRGENGREGFGVVQREAVPWFQKSEMPAESS